MTKRNGPPVDSDPSPAPRRLPFASADNGRKALPVEPLADKLRHVRAILRAVEESQERNSTTQRLFEPTALDCLKQLVEAIDKDEGVEDALLGARAVLKTAGFG